LIVHFCASSLSGFEENFRMFLGWKIRKEMVFPPPIFAYPELLLDFRSFRSRWMEARGEEKREEA
jgi:hypothetical protein